MLFNLTLVLAAVVVLGLAAYLTAVAIALLAARRDVTRIADALEAVAAHTAPLEETLVTANGALGVLGDALDAADGHLGRAARACRL
jgi:hypothetical protein